MISKMEFQLITNKLGRAPNKLEEACFENIWSEHCSYKSSYLLLQLFDTKSENVIIGPGDDAAVIKYNENLVISIAMESHNHPSYIQPYEGAATGVGGIVRDILSMGTKPIVVMPSIYIGKINEKKNKWLLKNIINGSSNYSKEIGVSIAKSDIYFDKSYNGNPLVNVIAIGIGNKNDVVTSISKTTGNILFLFGSKTGIDGFGGASFASGLLSSKESVSPNSIPKGYPKLELKLINATIEAIKENLIESCRDLGAAGVAGATAELAAKGKHGVFINATKILLKQKNMSICEIMLSESQERMLAEVKPENMT